MVTKCRVVFNLKNIRRFVCSVGVLVLCLAVSLVCVPRVVAVTASGLQYANLFDYPCTAIQVHSTELVEIVDGFSDLYRFSTEQDTSYGNTSIPVTWYFTGEWFTTSTMHVEFSFLCDNPAMIKAVTFGVGSEYFTCAYSSSDGIVVCHANIRGKLISPHFSISMNLAVLDSPYELYFQFLDCSVTSSSYSGAKYSADDMVLYNTVTSSFIDASDASSFEFTSADCTSYDYSSAVSLGKPFLGNYNLTSPLPGAGEPQYLSLQGYLMFDVASADDQFFSMILEFPGTLIYCSVVDEYGYTVPATISSFVSDGANVEVTTDRAVHAYRITGTQKVLKSCMSSYPIDEGTRTFIKYDPDMDYYYVSGVMDYGSFIYDDVESYIYTTESWESTASGSALLDSKVGISWNASLDCCTYQVFFGVLLPVVTSSTYTLGVSAYSSGSVDRGQVSVDTAYLGDVIGDKADELIYTIKQFFPNSTALNSVINDINTSFDSIHDVQSSALDSLGSLNADYDSYRDGLDHFITDDHNAFISGFDLIASMLQIFINAYYAGNMIWVFARIAFFGVAAYVVSRGRMPKGSKEG